MPNNLPLAERCSQATHIKIEHSFLVGGIIQVLPDELHEVEGNAFPAAAIGKVGHLNAVCHHDSFRGCFALATITKAGGAASLSGGGDRPSYKLRGRFAARHTFVVPEGLTLRDEPTPVPQLPRWYSIAAFLIMSSATIFAMCAIGRPGA